MVVTADAVLYEANVVLLFASNIPKPMQLDHDASIRFYSPGPDTVQQQLQMCAHCSHPLQKTWHFLAWVFLNIGFDHSIPTSPKRACFQGLREVLAAENIHQVMDTVSLDAGCAHTHPRKRRLLKSESLCFFEVASRAGE